MLGRRNVKFVGCESFFNKNWAQKVFTLSLRSQHGRKSKRAQPRQLSSVEKAALAIYGEVSGKIMRCCWLERKKTLVFCHVEEFSCRQLLLREQILLQRLFATYLYGSDPLACSRKLSVRLCAASMLKWPFTPWRGQVTQRTWQNLVFPGFPGFC